MAWFASSENVFTGVSLVDIGEDVVIRAATGREGKVTVQIRPEDIILSRGEMESSARNSLRGRVVSLEDRGNVVRLKLDVGKVLIAQITRRSLIEMVLNVRHDVYLTFKASSVQLI